MLHLHILRLKSERGGPAPVSVLPAPGGLLGPLRGLLGCRSACSGPSASRQRIIASSSTAATLFLARPSPLPSGTCTIASIARAAWPTRCARETTLLCRGLLTVAQLGLPSRGWNVSALSLVLVTLVRGGGRPRIVGRL